MAFSKMKLVPIEQTIGEPITTKVNKIDNEIKHVFGERRSDDEKVKKLRKLLMDFLHYYKSGLYQRGRMSKADKAQQSSLSSTQRPTQPTTRAYSGGSDMRGPSVVSNISEDDIPGLNNLTSISSQWPSSVGVTASTTPVETPPPLNFLPETGRESSNEEFANTIAAITHRPDILTYSPVSGQMLYHGNRIANTDIVDLIAGVGEARDIFTTGVNEVLNTLPLPPSRGAMRRLQLSSGPERVSHLQPRPKKKYVISSGPDRVAHPRRGLKRKMNSSVTGVKKVRVVEVKNRLRSTKPSNVKKIRQPSKQQRQPVATIIPSALKHSSVGGVGKDSVDEVKPLHTSGSSSKDRMDKLILKMKRKRSETDRSRKRSLLSKRIDVEKEIRQAKVNEKIKVMRRMGRKRMAKPTLYGPPRKYMRINTSDNGDDGGNKLLNIIKKAREANKKTAIKNVRRKSAKAKAVEKIRRQRRANEVLKTLRHADQR
jgi:hypothetical protein